jgi:hypothetical protein
MNQDKRRSQRAEAQELVRVYVLEDPDEKNQGMEFKSPVYLKAKNFSQEGLCLETAGFLIPDRILRLDFQSVHNGHTQAFASVIWSEKNACGLRFLKEDELLNRWLNQETA